MSVLLILVAEESERCAAASLFTKSEAILVNGKLPEVEGRNCLAIGPTDWESTLRGQIGHLAGSYRGDDPKDALPGGTLQGALEAGWTAKQVAEWTKNLLKYDPSQRSSEGVSPGSVFPPPVADPLGAGSDVSSVAVFSPAANPPAGDSFEPPPDHYEIPPDSAYSDYAAGDRHAYRNEIEAAAPAYDGWGEPSDLLRNVSALPQFRFEWMPPALRDYMRDVSECTATDPGFIAWDCLGIAAGQTPDTIRLRIKQGQPWNEPARMWPLIISPSGSTKTPPLLQALKGIESLQEEVDGRVGRQQHKYKLDMEVYESERRAYVSARAKDKSAIGLTEPDMPPEVMMEQVVWMDFTIESLGIGLRGNPRGAFICLDEIAGLISGANQYKTGGNDIEKILELHNGGPGRINRVGRPIMHIANWGAGILGGTQPSKLRTLNHKGQLTDNGFLQRFVPFCSYQEARVGAERNADYAAAREWARICNALYNMKPALDWCQFTPDAQIIQREQEQWAVNLVNDQSLPGPLRDWSSKMRGLFGRLCILYHSIACAAAGREAVTAEVGLDVAFTVQTFMRECLFPHAFEMFGAILGSNDVANGAVKVAEYILAKRVALDLYEVSLTDIAQGQSSTWSPLREFPAKQRAIIGTLIDGRWLIPISGKISKPTGMELNYQINPRLRSEFSEHTKRIIASRETFRDDINAAKSAKAGREPGQD